MSDDSLAFRILCLSTRGHPDAKGIPSRVFDEGRIALREKRKALLAEQAGFFGVHP
jgi:hypothetical protein